jgi:lipopolysaccharide/colanic/teichoic acid biosynthesis glycosyltransferase
MPNLKEFLMSRRVATLAMLATPPSFVPPKVQRAKRVVDIVVAGFGLLLTFPLWPVIALAIRLESAGPAIYRQLRVGIATPDGTSLFVMLKFRSMRYDAEQGTGAVWAQRDDARVTRVGRVLRRLRLDELPQLINVLRGDMSIVGPRPERPEMYRRLEAAVPFYSDRTMGLRPGITGLAQVSQGYDASLDDVRRKLGYDSAYAMRLTSLAGWFRTDVGIMLRTLGVMLGGRGR